MIPITRTLGHNLIVVELQGRFETTVAQDFVVWFNDLMLVDTPRVIVNLRNVKLMGSTGLTVLIYALKRLRERHSDLYLCNVPDTVQQVFKLTRLNLVFTIFRDEAEARRALSAASDLNQF